VYPVTISIRGDLLRAAAGPDPAGLIDILWAHALPEDRLELIAQNLGDEAVDITLFIKSDALESAYLAAIRVCNAAIGTSRALADWKLVAGGGARGVIRIL
jgi:hypothetical protein